MPKAKHFEQEPKEKKARDGVGDRHVEILFVSVCRQTDRECVSGDVSIHSERAWLLLLAGAHFPEHTSGFMSAC